MPLEGRMGFGGKVGDRNVKVEAFIAQLSTFATQPSNGIGDTYHINISFPWQTDHKVKFYFIPATGDSSLNSPQ